MLYPRNIFLVFLGEWAVKRSEWIKWGSWRINSLMWSLLTNLKLYVKAEFLWILMAINMKIFCDHYVEFKLFYDQQFHIQIVIQLILLPALLYVILYLFHWSSVQRKVCRIRKGLCPGWVSIQLLVGASVYYL